MIENGEGTTTDGEGKAEGDQDNGPETEKDQPDQTTDNEQEGNADTDGETESGEGGEEGGEDEGENGEKEGDTESGELAALQKTVQQLQEELHEKKESAPVLSDEQWEKKEQEWGVPRSAIENMTKQNMQVYNAVMKAVDSRLAKLDREDAISSLGKQKGYTDASQLREGINDFLKDVDPSLHSNETWLKKAVVYARGLGLNNKLQKVRNETEKNRRIATDRRPAGSSSGQRTKATSLTNAQKEAALAVGMTEKEYAESLSNRGKPIAL